MANPNDGQVVAAAWEAYVNQDPEDNIFDRYWLLENLREHGSFEKQHGRAIFGTVEYATNPSVKFMSELETLDNIRYDVFDQFEGAWKHVGGDVVHSYFEDAITAAGGGKFDLLAKKIDNLKHSFQDAINASLFSDGTGTSSKEFGGLQYLVASTPTSGTVLQINRASFSFWRNQQASGAKSSTAFDNLKSTLTSVYNLCSNGVASQTPTFAVTTRTVFQGYEGLLTALERYDRTGKSDVGISGFKGDKIQFKDIAIAYDNDCPSGVAYLLNHRNLKFVHMYWMKNSPAQEPTNQFAKVFKVLTTGNLITDNPRRLGCVTAIT